MRKINPKVNGKTDRRGEKCFPKSQFIKVTRKIEMMLLILAFSRFFCTKGYLWQQQSHWKTAFSSDTAQTYLLLNT